MGNYFGNVIRVDPKVMHGASPDIPGRLIVKVDMAGSDAYQHIPHTGYDLIKDDDCAKHFGVKPDAGIEIGCEKMDVMKIAVHMASSLSNDCKLIAPMLSCCNTYFSGRLIF
jgi:hypothetical protein